MIAKNLRKYPEAMALQLVLVFGRPVWNSSRPTTRIGRAIRSAQASMVKATPQLVQWVKISAPQWFRDQVRRAKSLAKKVELAMTVLVWDAPESRPTKNGRQSVKRSSWAVLELLDDYDETHHGNQARFLTSTLETKRGGWFHIASGYHLRGATKRQTSIAWACAD